MHFIFALLISLALTSCKVGAVYEFSEAAITGLTGSTIALEGTDSISIGFDASVDTSTVTRDTFYVTNTTDCSLSSRISGTVACASSKECTFTPVNSWDYNTQYTICLTTGIKYADGVSYIGSTIPFTPTRPTVPPPTPPSTDDTDGDGIYDYLEDAYSEVPLVHNLVGWIWLTSTSSPLYRPVLSGRKSVPTGIVVATGGLDKNDPTDAAADFDDDGTSNADEITAGTNIFVAATSGQFITDSYDAGGLENPAFLTLGDFDNDGDLDFAITSSADDKVAILENIGGSFEGADEINLADLNADPIVSTAGDFDGDGILDIVVAENGESAVEIFIGNGSLGFSQGESYDLGSSGEVGAFVVNTGDFDGDGDLDLVATNPGENAPTGNTISTLIGAGDGTFGSLTGITINGSGPLGVGTADFNNDYNLDLVVTNTGSDSLSILLGDGEGGFNEVPTNPVTGDFPLGGAVCDLDDDGWLDTVASNRFLDSGAGGTTISVFIGNGDGTFAEKADYTVGLGPTGLVCGDLDGDSDMDIAVANIGTEAEPGNTVSVLLGNGGGTLAGKTDYTVGSMPLNLAIGDLDNDGDLDLVSVNNGDGTITVLLNE